MNSLTKSEGRGGSNRKVILLCFPFYFINWVNDFRHPDMKKFTPFFSNLREEVKELLITYFTWLSQPSFPRGPNDSERDLLLPSPAATKHAAAGAYTKTSSPDLAESWRRNSSPCNRPSLSNPRASSMRGRTQGGGGPPAPLWAAAGVPYVSSSAASVPHLSSCCQSKRARPGQPDKGHVSLPWIILSCAENGALAGWRGSTHDSCPSCGSDTAAQASPGLQSWL